MAEQTPGFEDFKKNFKNKKTQLLWKWVAGDLETPVSAYTKLCAQAPNCFLLESVEGGKTLGRYSMIGLEPDLMWSCDIHNMQARIRENNESWKLLDEDPLTSLRQQIARNRIDIVPAGLPPMAASGLFGYLGYDMVRLAEAIPDENPNDLDLPDTLLIRPGLLAVFDNVKNMICLIVPVYEHAGTTQDAQAVYDDALTCLHGALKKLETPLDQKSLSSKSKLSLPLQVRSNTSEKEYYAMVQQAVEYIHAGEIFQVVPSQRFDVDFDLPSFELYRSLRQLNPSPFMFHLAFEGFSLVGASPEILVRVRDNTVTIRPIAGTRKRGKDEKEDKALAEELLNDPKERAEHLMLLDLGRNDVGRVAQIGTVRPTEEFVIEYYSHVMHIVSNVEGKLRDDLDIVDALLSGFPAGTVSGAPKVRAMEIIDELEKSRRSFYGGCIGYLSGNGILDTCIALRTALVKDGKMYVQAGGGVVADSTQQAEYQESRNKAQALITAAEQAIEKRKG